MTWISLTLPAFVLINLWSGVYAFAFSPKVSHRVLPSPFATYPTSPRDAWAGRDKSKWFLNEHPVTQYPDQNPYRITAADQIGMLASTSTMLLALTALLYISGPGAWRYYLAGGICAATSHSITTPIDVVKTRMQVEPHMAHMTTPEAAMYIVKNEGPRTLLSGLGPTTVGYLMEGAVKFGIYEVLKPVVRQLLRYATSITGVAAFNSQLLGLLMCGTASGFAASLMLCPMEALRIRLVAEPDFAPNGWIQGGFKMLRIEGVRGLWKGIAPMLYKQVPYTITKNVSFDILTKGFYSILRNAGYAIGSRTKVAVPLVAAMSASILSSISSQPGDVLLSLVNAHEGDRSTRSFLREIWKSPDGLKGLFVGMRARFLHVGIIVTTQLLIYDVVKRFCGIAATGMA